MEDMQKRSNCECHPNPSRVPHPDGPQVTQAELERLKKRFMKLDRFATRVRL